MSYYYSDPRREEMETALPDVEVFYIEEGDENFAFIDDCETDDDGEPLKVYLHKGWYYWFCFPGYMPEGDMPSPEGPFDSEEEAVEDCRENAGVYDE